MTSQISCSTASAPEVPDDALSMNRVTACQYCIKLAAATAEVLIALAQAALHRVVSWTWDFLKVSKSSF
jgi:hypothetical protein